MLQTDDIIIDDEFKSLLRPLTEQERLRLMQNIERDRLIRDPIVVWAETMILVDGHHRLEIWNSVYGPNSGFPAPGIIEMSFRDREAVKDWIVSNQNGRRNNDKWLAYHRGSTPKQQGSASGRDATEIRQLSRDREFREACDTLEEQYGEDTVTELLSDEDVTKRSIQRVAAGELPITEVKGKRKPRSQTTPAERVIRSLARFTDSDWDEFLRVIPNDVLDRIERHFQE